MELAVKQLENVDFERWDSYVESAESSTFFHRAGWKTVLERAFGHTTYFLYVEKNGEISGILPLAQVKSVLFGNSLASLPFCVYGGIVADDQQSADALTESACELAESLGVGALEIRNLKPSGNTWPVKSLYSTFRKTIDPDPEVNLKAIPSKQRTMIRKGIRSGMKGEIEHGYDRLYAVYSESVRNLGTPVFSKKYFKVLTEVFADDCDVLMIQYEGEDVAGVLSFYFKGQVLPYYGGSVARARTIKAVNHFMYWDLLCRAAEKGCTVFDFGRSKDGTGPYNFKRNWGFEPEPLSYEYHLVKLDDVPEVNPNNPKYRHFISMWKKLPLPVANTIGPFLARSLG